MERHALHTAHGYSEVKFEYMLCTQLTLRYGETRFGKEGLTHS